MTVIKLKNSTVVGKVPSAGDLVNAELAINLTDQKLYSKGPTGVFEIGGASVGQGPTPPGNGNETGDLWWDGDVLLVWNGSEWEVVGGVTSVNGETGEVVLGLGDLDDVTLSPLSNGDIIAWNGSAWVNSAAPPADISGSSINDLNDVDTNGVDDGDILVWNSTAGEWQATDRGTVPENTSDLNNDGENGTDPFITEAQVNNILDGNKPDGTPDPGAPGYLKPGDDVSELNNNAGYITDAGVTKIVAGTNITIDPTTGEGEVTINASDAAALALDDLTDVEVPSPDDGDVLAWNGSNWVSAAAPPADISGSSINQLNDVDASGASNGQILTWNGTEWVNTDAPEVPEKTSDLINDGNGDAGEVFVTEGEVTNILNGLNPDGSPDAGNPGYLKPGDKVSELNNDAGYLTSADTAGDSDKLGGQDPDYYLNYQNFTNIPPMVDKIIAGTGITIDPVEGTGDVTINATESSLWTENSGKLSPATLTNDVLVGGADAATATIQLTAGGKGVFANEVETDAYFISKSNSTGLAGCYLYNHSGDTSRTDAAFIVSNSTSSASTTASISYDGSASFASNLARIDRFGQMNVNTPTAAGYAFQSRVLDADDASCIITGAGSIDCDGPISPGDADSAIALVNVSGETGGCLLSTNKTDINTSRTANIGAAGKAWNKAYFSGDVVAGGYSLANLVEL